ncbi:alcohol dehydrogenase class IV [Paenarthrobacter nicotinovorans]|jgi:alcohol dehydrogenase class IV|uniref:maleylacetate reductase n=1 Tax=Paenarthrobacter nicotinovorans TaxID=29320 RepID=UPI00277DA730|nr:maleylacetate reductase [Paenarthrobacter nicotinovorans]MDP9936750.1 alcohol dehydrogenase class IV [Paenarthrobacter nicotinovorans]
MGIAFDHKTLGQRVIFGTGEAVANTTSSVKELGSERVLLIAGTSSQELATSISAQVPGAVRIDEVIQHVPAENAAQAVATAQESACDAIVCVGGGSATGLAKAVALKTALPIVALPTTFSGSEATDVWGITDQGRKSTGSDARVLPAVVVYDASLTAGLPAHLAIASGINAMAHAIDGFWAPRTDPINRAMGAEALRALVPGLKALHRAPGDIDAREQTLYGAYLAAVAFASAGSGLHHKICHVLGGRYGLSHAEMHSIVLAYVTAYNAPAAPHAAKRISETFDGLPAEEALFRFREDVDAPKSLAALGLNEEDLPEAAALCLEVVPATNPRTVTRQDLENILRLAWSGEPIEKGQL